MGHTAHMALESPSNEHAQDTGQAHPDWVTRTMAAFRFGDPQPGTEPDW